MAKKKTSVRTHDALLLSDGQIVKFNPSDYVIVIKNGKIHITFSDHVKDMIYGMDIPIGKSIVEPREVVAKVKLMCKLIKK